MTRTRNSGLRSKVWEIILTRDGNCLQFEQNWNFHAETAEQG
jgi:hypothetical protein